MATKPPTSILCHIHPQNIHPVYKCPFILIFWEMVDIWTSLCVCDGLPVYHGLPSDDRKLVASWVSEITMASKILSMMLKTQGIFPLLCFFFFFKGWQLHDDMRHIWDKKNRIRSGCQFYRIVLGTCSDIYIYIHIYIYPNQ